MPRGRKKQTFKQDDTPKEYPILVPIYGGRWQAHGDGWAVDGDTPEEAKENYYKAEQRHKEILQLPPWYVQKHMRGEE